MKRQGYHYPAVFPREAFVQAAIEQHFKSYVLGKRGYVDFGHGHQADTPPLLRGCRYQGSRK